MKAIKLMSFMAIVAITTACNDNNNNANTSGNNEVIVAEVVLENMTELSPDSTRRMEYQIDKISNTKHGTYKEFDVATNKLMVERNYKKNQLDGVEKIYFDNGQVDGLLSYKDGIHHGEFSYFYEDGKIKQKGNYVDGKMEGMLISYFANGNVKEEISHVGGLTKGPFKEYNENGTVKAEGEFTSKDDDEELEQGLFKEYDGNGELVRKMMCKEGTCCTIWTIKEGDVKAKGKICEAIIAELQKKES